MTTMYQGSDGRPIINSGRTAAHSGFRVRTQAKYDTDGRYILRTGGNQEKAYIPLKPTGNIMSESMQSLRSGTIGAVISDDYREAFGLEPLSSREGNDEFVPIISNVMGMAIATGTKGVEPFAASRDERKHRERMASVMCDMLNYSGIIGDEVLVSMEDQQAPRTKETQLDMVNVGSYLLPMDPGHHLKVFHPLGKHIVTDENARADGRLSVKEISIESFAKKIINDSQTYDREVKNTGITRSLIERAPMNSTNVMVATKSEKVGHLFNAGMAGVLLHFLGQVEEQVKKNGSKTPFVDAIKILEEYINTGDMGTKTSFVDYLAPGNGAYAIDDSNPVDYCRNNGLDMLLSACAMRANADRPVMIATQVKRGGEKSAGCFLVDGIFSAI